MFTISDCREMLCSCTLLSVHSFPISSRSTSYQIVFREIMAFFFLPVLLAEPEECLALAQWTCFYEIAFHGTSRLV